MVDIRFIPLNPSHKMPALGITLSPAALLLAVLSCTVSSQPRWLRVLPSLGYFLRWVIVGIAIISFSGCTTTRTAAVVEDRSIPRESQTPQQKQPQQEEQVRVYKLEEPDSTAPQPLSDIPDEEAYAPVPLDEPAEQKGSPAVVALLDDADQYAVSGKKQEAVASIERALRIEPKNPLLWHKLGQLRLQNGEWDQAIAMAKKSNVLATGNRSLQADNWVIIAKARDAMGDKQGAAEALNNAYQLRN